MKYSFWVGSTGSEIYALIENLKKRDVETEFGNQHCISILSEMLKNPDYWGNIDAIGMDFIRQIRIYNPNADDMDILFSMLFRFLMEVFFHEKDSLSEEILLAKEFAIDKKETFTKAAQDNINYAIHEMPFSIMRHKFQSEDIQHFIDAARAEKSMEERMIEWDGKIKNQIQKVEDLNGELKNQERTYNFIGLYKGFHYLSKIKKIEAKKAACSKNIFGFLVIIPLVFEFYRGTRPVARPVIVWCGVPLCLFVAYRADCNVSITPS
ncbi:hypothetical protein EH203_05240 [Pectobacterium carotovorum subsp. carotovorum]|uniref:hypothetical protein n=1 Tax=Pectobacterium carotovorum TaxID=554 RepID=UPI00137395DD|nr:hypothetical protein [Pectobacterium carotovorum]QHP53302.1 hypothetical protein EH203_05240 [Pectobacterium carotovorum subsp. carotovorum]